APGTRPPARGSAPPTRPRPRRRRGSSPRTQLLDLRPRARVQDLLLREPRAASLRDAHLDVLQRAELVRVGVDGDLDPSFARHARMRVAQVEPVRLRVDL